MIQVNAVEWSDTESESSLRNTLGVNVGDRSKSQLVFAQVTMKEGDDLRDGYKGAIVENIETFDQDAYVKDLIEQVAGTLNARSMKSKTCPVILKRRYDDSVFMLSGRILWFFDRQGHFSFNWKAWRKNLL